MASDDDRSRCDCRVCDQGRSKLAHMPEVRGTQGCPCDGCEEPSARSYSTTSLEFCDFCKAHRAEAAHARCNHGLTHEAARAHVICKARVTRYAPELLQPVRKVLEKRGDTRHLPLRLTAQQRARYQSAADRVKMNLTKWILQSLDDAAASSRFTGSQNR